MLRILMAVLIGVFAGTAIGLFLADVRPMRGLLDPLDLIWS